MGLAGGVGITVSSVMLISVLVNRHSANMYS